MLYRADLTAEQRDAILAGLEDRRTHGEEPRVTVGNHEDYGRIVIVEIDEDIVMLSEEPHADSLSRSGGNQEEFSDDVYHEGG